MAKTIPKGNKEFPSFIDVAERGFKVRIDAFKIMWPSLAIVIVGSIILLILRIANIYEGTKTVQHNGYYTITSTYPIILMVLLLSAIIINIIYYFYKRKSN